MDGFVEKFFLVDEFTTVVLIYTYAEKCALLTDTEVVKDLAINDPSVYVDISKNCIIALRYAWVESARLDELLNTFAVPVEHRDAVRGQLTASLSRKVFGTLYFNNHEVLAGYNQICVKAAAFQVFSASIKIDGVVAISEEDSNIYGDGELGAPH